MISSRLRYYSIGVVVKDIVDGEMNCEIWPVEVLMKMDGELDGEIHQHKSNGIDFKANEYVIYVDCGESINCEWFSLETNRRTAPNVRRGEHVIIWQYADADVYYWTSMGRDDRLRRGEHIIYSWSDVPFGEDEDADLTNSYTLEIDTFTGHVTLQTVKRNGEEFAYQWTINPGENHCTLQDDVGNIIKLDSSATLIHLTNADGTIVELNRENINMDAPDSINMVATNDINFQCTNYNVTASDAVQVTTATFTMDASTSTDITSPTINLNGKVNVGNGLAVTGGKPADFTGPISGTDIQVTGGVIGPNSAILHAP